MDTLEVKILGHSKARCQLLFPYLLGKPHTIPVSVTENRAGIWYIMRLQIESYFDELAGCQNCHCIQIPFKM